MSHVSGSGLEIVADGFIGQFDILTKTDLQDKLERDEIVQGILSDVTKIWEESSRAVLEYCEDTRWMVPICEFIRSVDGQSMEQIMSRELPEIQQMLNQVKSFIIDLRQKLSLIRLNKDHCPIFRATLTNRLYPDYCPKHIFRTF